MAERTLVSFRLYEPGDVHDRKGRELLDAMTPDDPIVRRAYDDGAIELVHATSGVVARPLHTVSEHGQIRYVEDGEDTA